ncbi:triose-phosphate isomerase [Rhodobacteraceae bacterium WD3A24]|nr:triose-phosphate isomerase [Rhodobacteraceae bacterium WD3A24]
MRRKLAAGNWKMNGLTADLGEAETLATRHPDPRSEVVICPPATLIAPMAARLAGSAVGVGGQDCHAVASGAHTGDIAAAMLADVGARHVILGHSERRADHHETDAAIAAKVTAAWAAGLTAILCVGETEPDRDGGRTLDVITAQLDGALPEGAQADNTVIAYEPVWAIGTGRTPSAAQIREVHIHLRDALARRFGAIAAEGIRLLYGGSVKPANAAEIFAIADVDGALVGGASLKASDFGAIIAALDAA